LQQYYQATYVNTVAAAAIIPGAVVSSAGDQSEVTIFESKCLLAQERCL
jgi:hypothetical protein